MEPIETLAAVQANAHRVIGLLTPEQMMLPCPCHGWDVAMLVDKMVTSGVLFGTLCRGEQPESDLDLLFPKPIGRHDPSGSFAAAAAACRQAFADSELEGEMMGPLGVIVPRRAGLNVRMMDCTINTWDMARSIGADHGITDDVAESLVLFASGFLPKVRGKTDHPRFAEPIDVDVTGSVEHLIAMSGRDPAWTQSIG